GRAPFTSIAVTDAAVDVDFDGTVVRGKDIDIDVTAEDGPVFDVVLRTGEQSIVRERAVLSLDPKASQGRAVDEDVVCQLDARVRFGKGTLLVRRLLVSAVADADPAAGTAPTCNAAADDPRRVEIGLRHVRATLPREGRPEVDGGASLRVPVSLTNRFLLFPQLKGYLSADLEGHYTKASNLPVIHGKIGGAGLELDRYHLMSDLRAEVTLDDDTIRVSRASIGFGDGTIVAKDVTVEPLKKGAPLRVGSVDASNVRFPALMRDLGVTPHAHVNWVYRTTRVGTLEGTLAPLKLDAEFSSNTSDFEVFDRAVDDPTRRHMIGVKEAKVAGHVAIRPDSVTFRGSRIDFGDSHLDATVSLGFHQDITLSVAPTSKLDLANISPLASLKLAGKATLGAEMSGKFDDPILTGDLAVTGFSLADFPLGDVTSSKVRFRPLIVDFSEIHGKKGKSTFDVPSARLDFDGPATLLADATVDASDLYVRDFLHMWHFDADPRFDPIDGHGKTKATVHYAMGGREDVCGDGLLRIRGGVHMSSMDLFDEHYDSVDSDFTYNWIDQRAADLGLEVDIRSFTLKKGRGSIFGSATVRRGGVVHGDIVADDIPLSRIQGMGALAKVADGTASAVGSITGTIEELAAEVDVRLSPLRVGGSVMPASKFHVGLSPFKKEPKVIGRTKCGAPITAPFDRAEFERDAPTGTFHVSGRLFDGQIGFDDFKISRQRKKVTSGLVTFSKLDLSALGGLSKPKDAGDDTAKDRTTGSLSAALAIASLPLDAPERMRGTLSLNQLDVRTESGKMKLKAAAPDITIGDDHLTLPPLDFEWSAGAGLRGIVTLGGEMKHLSGAPDVNLAARVAPIDLASLTSIFP
ncbi:MAG TPA: hypothetical protein VJT73_07520, partial [Polyangiaceae bacterium]|nr:hypothetical protein [Polyangiaceae bacterium]